MNRFIRAAALLLFSGLALLGVAQPMIWKQDFPDRTLSKMARDTSGHLYHVSREAVIRGRYLHIVKYTPNGSVVWQTSRFSPNQAMQFDIRNVVTDDSYLYVVAQERGNDGLGAVQRSYLLAYSLSSGALAYVDATADAREYNSVASNGTQVAVLYRSYPTGVGTVLFLQRSNWSNAGTVVLGNVSSVAEVRMDAAGFAYTGATNTNGTVQIAKASAAGGLAFQTTLDATAPRVNEVLYRVEVDTVAQRVYAIGTSDWSPTDQDVMMYIVNSSTGAQVAIPVVRASSADDLIGDLTVVPNGGIIASAATPSNSETVVSRRNTSGTLTWSTPLANTPEGNRRSHGRDADGNLVVMSPTGGASAAFDRIAIDTGQVLVRHTIFMGSTGTPLELRTDAAGNFFVNADIQGKARFMRLQVGLLAILTNNLVGGSQGSARIYQATTAVTNQDWQVSSSNPAVATVPATVTVTAGLSNTSFNIQTFPVASITNVSINARHGGFVSQQTLTVVPANLQGVQVSPQVIKGGIPATGTVQLTGGAPTGSLEVSLSSNKPLVASVPTSVSVPASAATANFEVTTYGVNSNQGVVVTAALGATSKTTFIAVNAPSLTTLSVTPATISGGSAADLTVTIDGIAPTGGFSILLFSGVPGTVTLPASTSVNAGQTSRSIAAPTAAVTTSINVTLIATRSGIYKTATLTVTP